MVKKKPHCANYKVILKNKKEQTKTPHLLPQYILPH